MSKKIWSELTVIKAIQLRNLEGKPISYKTTKKEFSGLIKAACAIFGSWDNAITEAGFDPLEFRNDLHKESWTPEKVLLEIGKLHGQGVPLHHNKIKFSHGKIYAAGKRYFGSWQNAIRAAGFDYEKDIQKHRLHIWSRERVIEEIENLLKQSRPINESGVDEKLSTAGQKYFGSWKSAVEAAGMDYNDVRLTAPPTDWTVNVIIKEIQRRHQSGKPINPHAVKDDNVALYGAIRRVFGSYKKMLILANLDPEEIYAYRERTPGSIITEIREIHQKGRSISPSNVAKPEYCGLFQSANKHFGSWGNAVKQAGINYYKVLYKENKAFIIMGHEFQDIVREIFEIAHPEMKYQQRYYNCIPDFSDSGDGHWIDAKLTPQSAFVYCRGKDVFKYLKHCSKLSLVYLTGNKPGYHRNKIFNRVEYIDISTYMPIMEENNMLNAIRAINELRKKYHLAI